MNYADKLLDLHGESVSDLIPENHLTLAVRRGAIDPDVIRTKYEPHVAEKLLKMSQLAADAAGTGEGGSAAVIYETNLRIVKKAKDADLNVYVDKDAEAGVTIVKDIRDAASYYPYTVGNAVKRGTKPVKEVENHYLLPRRGKVIQPVALQSLQ